MAKWPSPTPNWPKQRKDWATSPTIAQHRANIGRSRLTLASSNQSWPTSVGHEIESELAKFIWPTSHTQPGRNQVRLGQVRRTSSETKTEFAKIGPAAHLFSLCARRAMLERKPLVSQHARAPTPRTCRNKPVLRLPSLVRRFAGDASAATPQATWAFGASGGSLLRATRSRGRACGRPEVGRGGRPESWSERGVQASSLHNNNAWSLRSRPACQPPSKTIPVPCWRRLHCLGPTTLCTCSG